MTDNDFKQARKWLAERPGEIPSEEDVATLLYESKAALLVLSPHEIMLFASGVAHDVSVRCQALHNKIHSKPPEVQSLASELNRLGHKLQKAAKVLAKGAARPETEK